MTGVFAHSVPGQSTAQWEPLADHLARVGDTAARFADVFGWGELARLAGTLHDVGKASEAFQAYLHARASSCDHSTAGARVAVAEYPLPVGRMLATIVAGHHAGLDDGDGIERRLDARQTAIPAFEGWQSHAAALPPLVQLKPTRRFAQSGLPGFTDAFLTRMLFSCLVDADFLETERFYAGARPVPRGGYPGIAVLQARLSAHMDGLSAKARPGLVNSVRAEVLAAVRERAALAPGLFTLTVPTGGGKTLASLTFALDHATRHGLRRVVHVAPFTAIIEQTAAVFRSALGEEVGILEHHATFDWQDAAARAVDNGIGLDPVSRLRRAAENWDAPVVVTTAVQLFESLFANRTSRCRKLHNLARSVIVLDEAQAMPLPLLRPCLAAIDELSRNYGVSVMLCTATQPALRQVDGFKAGLPVDDTRELAPDPPRLYRALRRVAVERLAGPISDETVARRFAEVPQMLCIVNSRRHAKALFDRIAPLPGAIHLSTLMCPRHRRAVLDAARAALRDGAVVRIVSTSLIEAGVDIDLPEVWRATAGLDAVAQAAGRCNREGALAGLGRVVVFEPADAPPPRELEAFRRAAEEVLRTRDDPLAPNAIRAYFRELYWRKGEHAFDAPQLDGETWPILPAVAERVKTHAFPFASIARAFRFIDDAMEPVIVPWRADPRDDRAEALLARIAAMDRPLGDDLRRLQAYVVTVPSKLRARWLALGRLRPVHPMLEGALLRLDDTAFYDPRTGLRLEDDVYRAPEDNIVA
ncbi:CRISPR-associated endonuclease/helicase Cas3 [Methylobacterium sp. 174MFSha1.1]|uniref:CRISPR-associated endonuclease Cas3'' n=1 Tax=Methylobacterium sp. 174MFSha1.1 TaxID=1502749 RepID=UPI0008DFB361|nr:CRISPR-associated endonuclease Cas3'' [Methylobacterium sp. 174MFSha1.1]SFU53278.1 CRISPR-associated endonuclease/helicase Cas3 [Methylobacterium sp. 174MFSha1.1]